MVKDLIRLKLIIILLGEFPVQILFQQRNNLIDTFRALRLDVQHLDPFGFHQPFSSADRNEDLVIIGAAHSASLLLQHANNPEGSPVYLHHFAYRGQGTE
ncbi:hypothetical protein D3C76_1586880 [compost metagenome]